MLGAESRMRKLCVIAMALLSVAGCSLLGPRPGMITQWLKIPTPGTLYTYTITTTWHDTSVSTETREYIVERVEERDDETTVVKFTDQDRLTSFFWIVDDTGDSIYESMDTVIDESDLLVLTAPVEEGADWSHGDGNYTIHRISSSRDTEVGKARNVVEIQLDYDGITNVELTVEWSPKFGLLTYEEDYDTGTSFISRYLRELTEVLPPE